MDQKTKEYIIKNLEWPIKRLDHLLKYTFVLIPISILVYAGIIEYSKGNSFQFSVVGIIIFLALAYAIEHEKRFIEILLAENISTNEVAKKLLENKFRIISESDGVLKILTPKETLSYAEQITIIKLPYKILINSQPSGTFPITLKNKANYDLVKKILDKLYFPD